MTMCWKRRWRQRSPPTAWRPAAGRRWSPASPSSRRWIWLPPAAGVPVGSGDQCWPWPARPIGVGVISGVANLAADGGGGRLGRRGGRDVGGERCSRQRRGHGGGVRHGRRRRAGRIHAGRIRVRNGSELRRGRRGARRSRRSASPTWRTRPSRRRSPKPSRAPTRRRGRPGRPGHRRHRSRPPLRLPAPPSRPKSNLRRRPESSRAQRRRRPLSRRVRRHARISAPQPALSSGEARPGIST